MWRCSFGQPAGDYPEQFVSGPMTERVIDDFEIIEIKKKKRPRSGLVAGQAGQCEIKARSIGEIRQRIGPRQTLALEDPLMAFEGYGAQVDASVDYSLFRGGWAPVLAIVEGEGTQDAVVAAANRRRGQRDFDRRILLLPRRRLQCGSPVWASRWLWGLLPASIALISRVLAQQATARCRSAL